MHSSSDLRTEDVHFFSAGAAKLAARLYLPDEVNSSGALPGVVFCHGFGGTKEGTPPGLSGYLARAGYVVLTFDYRGFGGSDGARGRLDPAEQIDDARHALAYLSSREDVDANALGLYGTSFGGGNAVVAAATSEVPVRAVVATVPVSDGEAWLRAMMRHHEFLELREKAVKSLRRRTVTGEVTSVNRYEIMVPDPMTREHYAPVLASNPGLDEPLDVESTLAILRHRPIDSAANLKAPLLVIGAGDDRLVPPEQASLLATSAPDATLKMLPGASHFSVYDQPVLNNVASSAIEWFDQHIREHSSTNM